MNTVDHNWSEARKLAFVMLATGCDEFTAHYYLAIEGGDPVDAVHAFKADRFTPATFTGMDGEFACYSGVAL